MPNTPKNDLKEKQLKAQALRVEEEEKKYFSKGPKKSSPLNYFEKLTQTTILSGGKIAPNMIVFSFRSHCKTTRWLLAFLYHPDAKVASFLYHPDAKVASFSQREISTYLNNRDTNLNNRATSIHFLQECIGKDKALTQENFELAQENGFNGQLKKVLLSEIKFLKKLPKNNKDLFKFYLQQDQRTIKITKDLPLDEESKKLIKSCIKEMHEKQKEMEEAVCEGLNSLDPNHPTEIGNLIMDFTYPNGCGQYLKSEPTDIIGEKKVSLIFGLKSKLDPFPNEQPEKPTKENKKNGM